MEEKTVRWRGSVGGWTMAEREEETEGKTWGKGSSGLCEGKWSGSRCWKNEWAFLLLAGQGEENEGTDWKMKGNGASVGVVQRL